jgi:hypothetical protein
MIGRKIWQKLKSDHYQVTQSEENDHENDHKYKVKNKHYKVEPQSEENDHKIKKLHIYRRPRPAAKSGATNIY